MEHDRTTILLEDMNGKIDAILEIVAPMRQELTEVKALATLIPDIAEDIQTIKVALTATNVQAHGDEKRITHLEAQTA